MDFFTTTTASVGGTEITFDVSAEEVAKGTIINVCMKEDHINYDGKTEELMMVRFSLFFDVFR